MSLVEKELLHRLDILAKAQALDSWPLLSPVFVCFNGFTGYTCFTVFTGFTGFTCFTDFTSIYWFYCFCLF